jgi:hypothetical protein
MSTKANCFYAEFEWEGIQAPLKVTRLNHGGLVLNENEKAALKARNQQTHSFADGDRPHDLWKNGELLRTLFYKIMLRLLDYSGEYLDYAIQHPEPKKLNPTREHNDAYRSTVYV